MRGREAAKDESKIKVEDKDRPLPFHRRKKGTAEHGPDIGPCRLAVKRPF